MIAALLSAFLVRTGGDDGRNVYVRPSPSWERGCPRRRQISQTCQQRSSLETASKDTKHARSKGHASKRRVLKQLPRTQSTQEAKELSQQTANSDPRCDVRTRPKRTKKDMAVFAPPPRGSFVLDWAVNRSLATLKDLTARFDLDCQVRQFTREKERLPQNRKQNTPHCA